MGFRAGRWIRARRWARLAGPDADGADDAALQPHNDHGVLDHSVIPDDGEPMHNPMRLLANGDGCELVFTLYRRPSMSEDEFARDAAWVSRDLAKLKALLAG